MPVIHWACKLIQHTSEDFPVPADIDMRYHQGYRARRLKFNSMQEDFGL